MNQVQRSIPSRPAAFRRFYAAGVALLIATGAAVLAQSSNATVPGSLQSYTTISSFGVEWNISGDADHDVTADTEYRVQGAAAWSRALPLVRVEYNGRNMLAGSILFLRPNTTYEVRITLNDPDGGSEARTVVATTRPVPALPAGGRLFHVVPGVGGGDGSSTNPYRGIGAAQAIAQPRDIFLLHAGNYAGRTSFNRSGSAGGNYIVWKAAGDGEAQFSGIDVSASHVWIEGVTVRNQPDYSGGVKSVNCPTDVVVTRSIFRNNHYSIFLNGGGRNWYIADNDIIGDNDPLSGSISGEGIELSLGSACGAEGHVIAHNSISRTADGISYPKTNTDIYGNDIFDLSDNGVEADGGQANIRIWSNRIHGTYYPPLSFQPQEGAPWYIIRNQIAVGTGGQFGGIFKFRETDRNVIVHNTFVRWGDMMSCCSGNIYLVIRSIVKNNLWVSATSGRMYDFGGTSRDWRTDIDYNGFDWGTSASPFTYNGASYSSLSAFSAASGLERNGIHISRSTCFESFNVPSTSIPPQYMSLRSGCNAVDAGIVLPNINDDFVGAAPDLGVYELGRALPIYGPRPVGPVDTTAPTVSITSPASGALVTGNIVIAASALDNVGVVGVQFSVDGVNLGAEDTSSPYSVSWNTATIINGTHTLRALARDAAGNSSASTVNVTVNNAADTVPPSPPTGLVAVADSAFTVSLSWNGSSDNAGVAGYAVYRNGVQIFRTAATGYRDAGLWPSTTYSYTVQAFDAAGNLSGASNAALANTAAAPEPDLVAPKATGAITIDGNLSDWIGQSLTNFAGRSNNVTAHFAWDDVNLYVAFTVTDAQLSAVQTSRDSANFWQDDSVEIFLDTLNDRTDTMQPDDYQFAVTLTNAQADLRGTGTGKDWTWNPSWSSAVVRQGTLNNPADVDIRYTVEVAIPWTQVGVTPVDGMYVGADVAVNDSDPSGPNVLDYFDWAGIAPASYAQPALWKRVKLTGLSAPRPPGAVVVR